MNPKESISTCSDSRSGQVVSTPFTPFAPMKDIVRLVSLLVLSVFAVAGVRAAETSPVYELRIYTTNPGKMPDLLARFRDHTCAIFARHGMASVGYWTPVDQKDGDKLYYFLRHENRAAATASWKAFMDDPEWQSVRKASEANGAIVSGVESIFLTLTDYSPAVPAATTGPHVFELRTYTTNEGKLEALDARFRYHTMALFAKHGMMNLPYWHPTDSEKGAGKTLLYLLAHASREAATKSWADFQADPEWVKVRNDSEASGKILIKDGVKSVFLTPTDFSALK